MAVASLVWGPAGLPDAMGGDALACGSTPPSSGRSPDPPSGGLVPFEGVAMRG